ncbi:MAG: hypothetical protein R3B96_23500 [Pirellulaceae bacterium]
MNQKSRVKVAAGDGAPTLVEQVGPCSWVKVNNEAGVTAGLRVSSPNANPIHVRSTGAWAEPEVTETELDNRWDGCADVR